MSNMFEVILPSMNVLRNFNIIGQNNNVMRISSR